jgi:hypothetical protein
MNKARKANIIDRDSDCIPVMTDDDKFEYD